MAGGPALGLRELRELRVALGEQEQANNVRINCGKKEGTVMDLKKPQ